LPAGADAEVGVALARFADAEGTPLRIERHSDRGIGRVVDVRKSLRSIELFEDDRVRARLDWGDGALVRFRVAVSHEGSARPSEVLAALFGADLAPRAELARLGLWAREPGRNCDSDGADIAGAFAGRSVDPLDVESLRRHATPAAGTAPEPEPTDDESAPDTAAL
jgi:hypothetical protein